MSTNLRIALIEGALSEDLVYWEPLDFLGGSKYPKMGPLGPIEGVGPQTTNFF